MAVTRSRRASPLKRRRSGPQQSVAISATEAKNTFGRILDTAIQGGRVVITRHELPKAVLISMAEFNALTSSPGPELETLTEEFDRLLADMQTPAARVGMKAAFHAKPKQLGQAAVAVARQRG